MKNLMTLREKIRIPCKRRFIRTLKRISAPALTLARGNTRKILNLTTRIKRRTPRWAGFAVGPVFGALAGLATGIPGVIIGVILGTLLQTILRQFLNDRAALAYYENPGASDFFEAEPGLAAFCGLALIISLSETGGGEAGLEQIARISAECFPKADHGLTEHFCRLASSRREELNPDLLAESLAARRKSSPEDPAYLGFTLYSLARNEKSQALARRIIRILDPAALFPTKEKEDPWKILGLPPGTPQAELKSHFRRLAMQFHPDELQVLDEEHRETAARAFIVFEQAYKEILEKG